MEAYSVDLCRRETGLLLQNKGFVSVNGPVLSISNSSHGKSINFAHAAWNKSGSQIAAGDCQGNVYIFYLQKNRFSLVYHFKTCCSFLTFSSNSEQDLMVALADCSIVSLNSESKAIKNHFNHHSSCVTHISFNSSGETVSSCSKDQAILWNLNTFHILRVLTLKRDVDIVKVFFLPDKDVLVSAFVDNSVFLWDFKDFSCINQFLCHQGDSYLNLKTIDASRDGKLLACAGKANWFLVWSILELKCLYTVRLPESVAMTKQINFLPVSDKYIVAVLSTEGEVHVFNLNSMEILHKLSSYSGKFISLASSLSFLQIVTISLQGNIELYDLEECIKNYKINYRKGFTEKKVQPPVCELRAKKEKTMKKSPLNLEKERLLSVLKNFKEYPEKHRFFIWSQLLELPHNVESFKVLHQESLIVEPFVKDCSFMNPGVQKTFLRLLSMLSCWFPMFKELEYMQCVVFPFIKILHKNTILCFELLTTFISNWCQNWFLFCPFPPFNILCVIENIISYHDQELMVHLLKNKVSSEIYAWILLKTSFSEVLDKRQWLKFWDHVFSNSLSFYLYAVAAFNIIMREALLKCKTSDQFKSCFRKHRVSASILLNKCYSLQQSSPSDIDPKSIVGEFSPVPKGSYPSFFQLSEMKIDLQTLTRKKIIDKEIHYLKQREDHLEIKSNYLKELQNLQMLRRKLLLETVDLQGTDALDTLNKKLMSVQNLIQDNLCDQVGMLKGAGCEKMFDGTNLQETKKHFPFEEYVKKLRK